ncbi:hypothetical protein EKO04_007156 [Ascochyta lentis]|uniref:Uncharacterized protein n=1 Tax=Ascochyta lentis TaxID=205686 RepID=A0A8H7MHW9_9PLEO|nr:hypothetical protein EKO04_007156 [Ascochyta lentis]
MPPKKKPAGAEVTTTNAETGDTKFSWTAENDRLLLILTMGRTLTSDDYHKLAETMPGSNYNGVRIRVSKMRVEQRKRFEVLGWGEPENASVKAAARQKTAVTKEGKTAAKKAVAGKRKGSPEDRGDGGEAQSWVKKARVGKEESGGAEEGEVVVKEEGVEEEV